MISDKQLRLVYSLLKPALRMAARFNIPVRAIIELVRLGYYELLSREGLSGAEIAAAFGQTPRHMRSLAQRLKSDFFSAELDVGTLREVEEIVAQSRPHPTELPKLLPASDPSRIEAAVQQLLREERLQLANDGRLQIGNRFVIMTSEGFHQRIDALNHHLDCLYRATVQRLIHDERKTTMIKTISFSARPDELEAFLRKLEGELRRELATMEESAAFAGESQHRFTLGLAVGTSDTHV